jgi:hypothetical protein
MGRHTLTTWRSVSVQILDRSGSVDLNRLTPIDKCCGVGLKRCRVVHGGGRRLATNDRRGSQLGAQLGNRQARFCFTQEANDLFFGKSLRPISYLWDWTPSLGATQISGTLTRHY